jgi:hypothetical protein
MKFEVVTDDLRLSALEAVRTVDALRALPAARRFESGAGCVQGSRLAEAMTEASAVVGAAIRQVSTATERVGRLLDDAATRYTRTDAAVMRGRV